MKFRMSVDSSIIISHLVGDGHKDDVLMAIEQLNRRKAELFFSLICYAEVWTGIELMNEGERKTQGTASFADILQANRIPHSSFIFHFSPALRKLSRKRSKTAGSL